MPAVPPPLRPHPAAVPLRGPEDALSVIYAAASRPEREETVVLLLDHAHRGLGCLVVVGRGPLTELAELLEEVALQEPAVAAYALASVRPSAGRRPGRPDLLAYHDLLERFDAVGVDLLDWFLVSGQQASSLAELSDALPRWRSA